MPFPLFDNLLPAAVRPVRRQKALPRQRKSPPVLERLEERCLLAVFTVTNTNDDGPGSLRQAILDANANPGLDTINFNIGSGVQTINVGSTIGVGLPAITDPVVIDGTTQPGYAGSPLIELNGTSVGLNQPGLYITAGSTTIKGLVINRFNSHGILLESAGGNIIAGNYIGTDVNGTADLGNFGHGVFIASGANNTIGGTAAS